MIGRATVHLPRDTSRQGQGILYGLLAQKLNRWSGIIILAFVIAHLVVQAIAHVTILRPMKDAMPWLIPIQNVPAVHAVLYAAIVFHSLYGFRLIAADFGWSINYRASFWITAVPSALVGIRELLNYVGS